MIWCKMGGYHLAILRAVVGLFIVLISWRRCYLKLRFIFFIFSLSRSRSVNGFSCLMISLRLSCLNSTSSAWTKSSTIAGKRGIDRFFIAFFSEISLLFLLQSLHLLSQKPVQLEVFRSSLLYFLQLLDVLFHASICQFILVVILELGKGVFFYFFLSFFISNTWLVCAVFCLKNSFSPGNINVFAILWVSSHYKPLWTLGTFHTKLPDFGCVKVTDPSFDRVEPHSLCYHVLTHFASDVKWSLVSYFAASHTLPLHYNEGFFMWYIAFVRHYFWWVKVFRTIIAVGSSCG